MPLLALLQSIADEPVAKYEWQRSSPLEMGKLCSSEQQTPKVGGEKTGLQSFTNTENPLGTTLAKFWKAKESTQAVCFFVRCSSEAVRKAVRDITKTSGKRATTWCMNFGISDAPVKLDATFAYHSFNISYYHPGFHKMSNYRLLK